MIGREILTRFLKHIHTRSGMNIPDFDIQVDNDFITLEEAYDLVLNHANIGGLRPFILCISPTNIGTLFVDEEYVPTTRIDFINFSGQEFLKRKRSFGFSDQDFGYVALTELFTQADNGQIDNTSEGFKAYLDYISTAIANTNLAAVNTLLDYLSTRDGNIGILIHKTPAHYAPISVYSYIYYKNLLRGRQLPLNANLTYSLPHGGIVNFVPGIIYEQYFEVFDIINELNHSSDIISRYLKMYHILEYLVYRVELVDIERKARVNRTFIREIHGLTGKSQSDKEFEVLKRNFGRIFSADLIAGAFSLTLNVAQRDFIRDHFSLSTFTHTDLQSVCALIYRIRNSIVHNKESEFHITSTNPDDYFIIIPIIKELIQKLERAIFDKISSNAQPIQYQSSNIQLY